MGWWGCTRAHRTLWGAMRWVGVGDTAMSRQQGDAQRAERVPAPDHAQQIEKFGCGCHSRRRFAQGTRALCNACMHCLDFLAG